MQPESSRLPPVPWDELVVLEYCDYYIDVQLWAPQGKLRPNQWLDNFTDEEKPFAVQVLGSFIYYPEQMVDQMLKAAILSLQAVDQYGGDFQASVRDWHRLVNSLIFCPLSGEIPNPSDSGYVFARKARQVLGAPQNNILEPKDVLQRVRFFGAEKVVFLDDFVGTGDQCKINWNREIDGSGISFADLAQGGDAQFYYCPLICTEAGYSRIKSTCPELEVRPLHLLPKNYSLTSTDSIFWPANLSEDGPMVLHQASMRAGLVDSGGRDVNDWQGYGQFGLAMAFYHSIPDACLPILYWEENGWIPLMRRT